jgi:hypothetical protein
MQHSNAKVIWRLRAKDTRGMGGWGARTAVLFYSSRVTTAGVAVDVLTLSVKTKSIATQNLTREPLEPSYNTFEYKSSHCHCVAKR